MKSRNVLDLGRRKFPRLKAPSFFSSPSVFGPRGRIINFSLGGIRVYSDYIFNLGQRLEFELFVSKEKSIKSTAQVVWIKQLPQASNVLYDVGLEFINLPQDALHELRSVGS